MSKRLPHRPDLVLENLEWVRRLCLRLVEDAAAADDLVQEVWLAASASSEGGEDVRAPRGWLASIARRLAATDRRRSTQRIAREQRAEVRPDEEPADDVVARSEELARVARLVLALDEPYRRTMLLRWFEGRSTAEVAAHEGITETTVATRLHRGRARLREALNRDAGAERRWALALVPMARLERDRSLASSVVPASVATTAWAPLAWIAAIALIAASAVWIGAIDRAPDPGEASTSAGRSTGSSEAPETVTRLAAVPAPERERRASERPIGSLSAVASSDARMLRIEAVDAQGRPAAGVPLHTTTSESPHWRMAPLGVTDAQGNLMHPWERVESMGHHGALFAADIAAYEPPVARLPEEFSDDPIRVTLPPTGTIVVEAVAPGGGPLAGRHSVELVADRPGPGPRTVTWRTSIDGEATFPYVALREGYIASVTGLGESRVAGPATIDETVRVVIAPRPEVVALEGRCVDDLGVPLTDARVEFTKLDPDPSGANARTDDDGRFVVLARADGQVPGTYRALLHVDQRTAPLRSLVDLPKALPGVRVALGDLVFRAPTPWVTGAVIDSAGQPIVGAHVIASARRHGSVSVYTGETGRFSLPEPWDFEHRSESSHPFEPRLEIRRHGFEVWEAGLASGGLRDAEIVLRAGRPIELTLAAGPSWLDGTLQLYTGRPGEDLDLRKNLHRRPETATFTGFVSTDDEEVRVYAGPYSGIPAATLPIPETPIGESAVWTVDLAPLTRTVTFEFPESGRWDGSGLKVELRSVSGDATGSAWKQPSDRSLELVLPSEALEATLFVRGEEVSRLGIPVGQTRVVVD